jgi:hypothetical protein
MKSILKECRFQSAEEVKQFTMMVLKEGTGNGPQQCYGCWQKSVTAEGNFQGGMQKNSP